MLPLTGTIGTDHRKNYSLLDGTAAWTEPRRVLDALSELCSVNVILPTRDGQEIRTRCATQPNDHQKILLQRLGGELPGRRHETVLEWKNREVVSLRRKRLRQTLRKLG